LPPSLTDIDDGPRYRKPRADLYTVLLVIALLALILGSVTLYYLMAGYEFKMVGAPSALGSVWSGAPAVLFTG